jgi:hypothetical protein
MTIRSTSLTLFTFALTAFALGGAGGCSAPPASDTGTPVDPEPAARRVPKFPRGSDAHGLIEGVTYVGDGCPGGSTSTGISADGEAFTSIFSDFVISAGPDAAAADAGKGCLLRVTVSPAPGWSYTVSSSITRGYVALEPGVSVQRQALYVVPGAEPLLAAPARRPGPAQDNFSDEDAGPGAPIGWSACGSATPLLIATQLRLDDQDDKDASSVAGIDTFDGELKWRRCE